MSAESLEGGTQPRVRVCVTDEGCGIGPKDLPHLFDRFYQARDGAAQAGRHEGWGLGLAIVKRIVELHGGTITVSSEPGRGTAVRTEWPAPAASPPAKSEATESPT
jgi:signal transduction histidine kinase